MALAATAAVSVLIASDRMAGSAAGARHRALLDLPAAPPPLRLAIALSGVLALLLAPAACRLGAALRGLLLPAGAGSFARAASASPASLIAVSYGAALLRILIAGSHRLGVRRADNRRDNL